MFFSPFVSQRAYVNISNFQGLNLVKCAVRRLISIRPLLHAAAATWGALLMSLIKVEEGLLCMQYRGNTS